ncbi:elongation factor Ts, mitochondrial-like [Boleophthalmus pectinirostris]|uniref:elongation factor Ts, mitochondrial-like n=1 Tax=Boleophthalmus pectinirostris TaxID=150288 RepID=UPI002430A72B|nr:elongation factor Ts, mitochondrial-like [Boleophthalmus pectinirostris]
MSLGFLFRSVSKGAARACMVGPVQSLHSGCPLFAAEKALLMKLRKSTGYTFTNCKKALEKFDNDITQAESWLHEQAQKEGWSKANKLEGRRAREGLVGVFVGDSDAVMVEVNCETDFVARNEKFQELVKAVAFATLAHHKNKPQKHTGYVKSLLGGEDLSKLTLTEGVTLADHVAFVIGRLGENMSVKRAVTLGVPSDWHIGSYVHGSVPGQAEVVMGRYGALVVFQGGPAGEEGALGRKLGQHVVGEAPVALGNMEDLPCGEGETRLLAQTFLGDPSRTVAQFLKGKQARVLDFVRFQCGEKSGEEGQ